MLLDSRAKNPAKQRAGRLGARATWGDHVPRVVRLDSLTSEQRFLIRALVEAAKAQTESKTAPGGSESPERSAEVRGGSLNDSAA